MQSCSDESFEINEVVWAKVLGYPWWPAQISSLQTGKNGNTQLYRVNFIVDGTHADLRLDKVKKWDQKPQQLESKRLREAIDSANQMLMGQCKSIAITLEQLNEHSLKKLVIKLNDMLTMDVPTDEIAKQLNSISNSELLAIIKMNLGSQLFQLHQIIKNEKGGDFKFQLQQFIDSIVGVIGYQPQPEGMASKKSRIRALPVSEETLEEITKCVIIQNGSDIKRKKLDDNFTDTNLNQQ